MSEKREQKVVDVVEVIEAELVEGEKEIAEKPSYVQIPQRAAVALDAVADTVATFSGEKAQVLRDKADAVRSIGKNVETAATAGKALFRSVGDAMDKLGIKVEMKRRVEFQRRGRAR